MTSELAHRETLTALIGAYRQAEQEIRQAYDLLQTAKDRLDTAFIAGSGYYFSINNSDRPGVGHEAAEKCMAGLKRDAWRAIIDRLEIRKMLSIKRREALERQISGEQQYCGDPIEPLPEITESNILAMFQDVMAKSVDYANEAVKEVFDWLRPQGGRLAELKTNNRWKLGKKVIIGYMVETGYRGGWRLKYHNERKLIALDNVFHLLDGRGPLKTHNGPLYDAIYMSNGQGETDFFRFKCYRNNNLHLEFKRMDLVNKINKVADSHSLGR